MSARSSEAQEQCQQIIDMYEALAQAVIDTGVLEANNSVKFRHN
jgi:hypothetical protein